MSDNNQKKQKLFESEVPTVKVNKIRMRETIVSYAFLAPVLIFFTVFVLAPMIMGFITSFFNYSMTSFEFVGLDNYIRMFKDPVFTKSLINTVILVIGSVPVVVLFSLFVASQLTNKMQLLDPSIVSYSSFLL